jgi:hypothetical protein
MFDTGGKLEKILSQKWALKFQPFFAIHAATLFFHDQPP